MRKKTHKQQRKLSTDTLLKTSKKKDSELTEEELGKISGGVGLGTRRLRLDRCSFLSVGGRQGVKGIPFLRTVGLPI